MSSRAITVICTLGIAWILLCFLFVVVCLIAAKKRGHVPYCVLEGDDCIHPFDGVDCKDCICVRAAEGRKS